MFKWLIVLHFDYSNEFLEGIIGRTKKIKNGAYGYRNWTNFIKRIDLQIFWFRARSSSRQKKQLDQLRSNCLCELPST
nr:transposase [Companilactobacillus suantsaicola]